MSSTTRQKSSYIKSLALSVRTFQTLPLLFNLYFLSLSHLRKFFSMKNTCDLPPGFRFHPTDEELIMYYLRNQASSRPCPASIIPEIDIYKFDPWELPEKAEFGENEWYFFSPRERKYPNGVRPNRATGSGYWKATGTDKAIYSGSKYVGVKKALVFYKGRPPKGVKTEWIMHEYRLSGTPPPPPPPPNRRQNGSMRLDDWVLCRIYVKRGMGRALERNRIDDLHNQMATVTPTNDANDHQQLLKIPPTFSIPHLMELDYGSISQLLSDNNSCFDFQNTTNHIGVDHYGLPKVQFGGLMTYQSADLVPKIEVNQSTLSNQSIFGDSGYGFQ